MSARPSLIDLNILGAAQGAVALCRRAVWVSELYGLKWRDARDREAAGWAMVCGRSGQIRAVLF